MTDYTRARKVMVDNQLRTSGITDRRLLAAMGEVPRELFVPDARRPLAYIDEAHPIAAGRKLGAPAPFAKLVQLAGIEGTDRVLDVGCGSGYSAAVLAHLAAEVFAVDSDGPLLAAARKNIAQLGLGNVVLNEGSIAEGGKRGAPYDVIVVEGELEDVPPALFGQLKPDGRLVAAVAKGGRPPVAHLFAKSGKGIAARAAFDARLPPLAAKADDSFVF